MHGGQASVPLVQTDLCHEDTVLQIAYSLDSLEAVVDSVFQTLGDRLKKGRKRLQDLTKRCQNAEEKVQKIKGLRKSITVYSSAKYPVPRQDTFFEDVKYNVHVEEPEIAIRHTPLPANKLNLKEKMRFYLVKDSTQLLRKNEEVSPVEGLGSIPENIKSVCSLLLYNTNEKIYENYKLIDPLTVTKQPTISNREEMKLELEPAPVSLLNNERLGPKHFPSFLYTPISQDVPEIQVPLDLPYLPGIADDLRYDEDAAIGYDIKDVVTIDTIEITEDKVTLVQELPKLEDSMPTDSLVPAPPPPPPPPPPPVPEPEPPVVVDSVVDSIDTLTKKPERKKAETEPPPRPVVNDMRANLMEDIRRAGGRAKLKPAQSRPTETDQKPGPMSLMEDLHDKLLMRRKGILGKSEGDGSLLEHIASMIPPPPSKQEESEDDEEEEEDPEWDD